MRDVPLESRLGVIAPQRQVATFSMQRVRGHIVEKFFPVAGMFRHVNIEANQTYVLRHLVRILVPPDNLTRIYPRSNQIINCAQTARRVHVEHSFVQIVRYGKIMLLLKRRSARLQNPLRAIKIPTDAAILPAVQAQAVRIGIPAADAHQKNFKFHIRRIVFQGTDVFQGQIARQYDSFGALLPIIPQRVRGLTYTIL